VYLNKVWESEQELFTNNLDFPGFFVATTRRNTMSWFAHRPARNPPQPVPVTPPHRM
jgi:hypothetical protein